MKKLLYRTVPVPGEPLTETPLETPPVSSESPPPTSSSSETPPTETPPAPATDSKDRYIGILEETLRESNRQIQQLMSAPPKPATPAPAAPSPEEEKQRFYNDPMGATRDIVESALKDAIAPLNAFVRGLKIDGSPFSQMMAKFKADARFASTLNDPQIIAAVERIMDQSELTEINMQSAIVHASGLKGMGLLGTVVPGSSGTPATPAPAPAAPTPAPSTVLPPHVRPSAAPTPAPAPNGSQPSRPPMTENQRRIMREQGFKTEKEYWDWMELPASEVAHTDLGHTPAPRS